MVCCAFFSNAQKRDAVWCFGDSALIDFSDTSNIITGTSMAKSRGTCASICDSIGQLLFYVAYDNDVYTIGGPPFQNGEIFNNQHNTMQNGDSVVMQLWYREAVIIDNPINANQYYVFSLGVTNSPDQGLYYSIVDMNANGGLGTVIQKNAQLQSFECSDGLTAIKHGNGRDWWIFFRRWDIVNNTFYQYLVSPSGISNVLTQNIGSSTNNGFSRIQFSNDGNKMFFYNYKGLLELYDFDRCTGLLSNPNTIYPENAQAPWPENWSIEFSPSGNILYLTRTNAFPGGNCYLVQYDLTAGNISSSADTLWTTGFNKDMGQLKLAPDGKIYLTCNYQGGYPYADTLYNITNMNLSVINSPDSLGSACNLTKFSFSLGGARTYFGLPNNPDYDLGAWIGSICDTLGVGIAEQQSTDAEFFIYYAANWQTAFINAQKLKGKFFSLHVFDLMGKEVFKESGKLTSHYYTKNLNCTSFSKGMYVVVFTTEEEKLMRKFLRE